MYEAITIKLQAFSRKANCYAIIFLVLLPTIHIHALHLIFMPGFHLTSSTFYDSLNNLELWFIFIFFDFNFSGIYVAGLLLSLLSILGHKNKSKGTHKIKEREECERIWMDIKTEMCNKNITNRLNVSLEIIDGILDLMACNGYI